jgi:DNA-binding transcriptional LysR family regulator
VRNVPDIEDLRAFVEVADQGSFTRAAERLFISQPALSRRIGRLERQLKGDLFHRPSHRRPTLTLFGQSLLDEARVVLSGYNQFLHVASARGAATEEAVQLAVTYTGANLALPLLYAYSQATRPMARLRIVECPIELAIHTVIRKRNAELAIASCEFLGDEYAGVPLGTVRHRAIGRPEFLGDTDESVEWNDLRPLPLLTPVAADKVRYGLQLGPVNIVHDRGEPALLLAMAKAGIGVALLSGVRPPPGLVGRQINLQGIPQETGIDLMWWQARQLSPGACRMVEEARRCAAAGSPPILDAPTEDELEV